MNPENNNNLENNFEANSLGQVNGVVTPDTTPAVGAPSTPEDTFTPFQDLNSDNLNVPSEVFDNQANVAAPVEQPVEFSQPAPVTEPAPSFVNQPISSEPVNTYSESVSAVPNAEPVPNMVPETGINDALNTNSGVMAQPESFNSFQTTQTAPVMAELEPQVDVQPVVAEQPVMEPAPTVNEVPETLNEAAPTETPAPEVQGPTIPIPESMPTTDYQANVSTPVDYATPMSDFDQIGTSPELDPKAKGQKKKNKLSLVLLLLLLIAALGGGCYYLINVKGIFNSSGVVTKEVVSEAYESLSTDINDYATFKNTSSSNCNLNVSKVDVTKVGTYEFIIECGSGQKATSYTGKITIKDTKAPEIEVNTVIKTVNQPLTATEFVSNSMPDDTYAFTNESEVNEKLSSTGLKTISITASDSSNNKKNYVVPFVVLPQEFNFSIIAKKTLTSEDTSASIIEKNVVLYHTSGTVTKDVGYTAIQIKFDSAESYKKAISSYDDSGSMTYGTYTGTPLFYKSENTIVLVKECTYDFITDQYSETYTAFGNNGYETAAANNDTNGKIQIDFKA